MEDGAAFKEARALLLINSPSNPLVRFQGKPRSPKLIWKPLAYSSLNDPCYSLFSSVAAQLWGHMITMVSDSFPPWFGPSQLVHSICFLTTAPNPCGFCPGRSYNPQNILLPFFGIGKACWSWPSLFKQKRQSRNKFSEQLRTRNSSKNEVNTKAMAGDSVFPQSGDSTLNGGKQKQPQANKPRLQSYVRFPRIMFSNTIESSQNQHLVLLQQTPRLMITDNYWQFVTAQASSSLFPFMLWRRHKSYSDPLKNSEAASWSKQRTPTPLGTEPFDCFRNPSFLLAWVTTDQLGERTVRKPKERY